MEFGFYGTFELDRQHDISEERIGAGEKLPLLLQLSCCCRYSRGFEVVRPSTRSTVRARR